jgi:hypothetical protein
MHDPVLHVVLDTSALASYFVPRSTNSERVREVMRVLFNAATHAEWPGLKIYVPAICVGETNAVFDKLWLRTGELTAQEYLKKVEQLDTFVHERYCQRVEQLEEHVRAAKLVSPVNQTTPRRKGGYMGGADCIIAAMSITLGFQVGSSNVRLLTTDTQMGDVMQRARTLSEVDAHRLGLVDLCATHGWPRWAASFYPMCLNLCEATEEELRDGFLGWPLPQNTCRKPAALSVDEEAHLWRIWLEIKRQFRVRGRESLPYGPPINHIRTRIACEVGIHLTGEEIYRFICNVQKRKDKRRQLDAASLPVCTVAPNLFVAKLKNNRT